MNAVNENTTRVFTEIGTGFAVARRRAKLSIADVASEMRLTADSIRALEAGSVAPFSSMVYVIGHVRSYARFLGLDDNAICARLRAAIDADANHSAGETEKTAAGIGSGVGNMRGVAETQTKARAEAHADFANKESPKESPGESPKEYHGHDHGDFVTAGLLRGHKSGRVAFAVMLALITGYGGWYLWDTNSIGIGGGTGGGESTAIIVSETARVAPAAEAPATALAEAQVEVGVPATITDAPEATPAAPEVPEVVASSATSTPETPAAPATVAAPAPGTPSAPVASAPAAPATPAPPAPVTTASIAPAPENKTGDVITPRTGQAIAVGRVPEKEITITASAASWLEIQRADGSTVAARLMQPGDEYVVSGDEDVYLTTGNAGGLTIAIGGRDAVLLGGVGETISELPLDSELLLKRY